jgi:hypothetical protein
MPEAPFHLIGLWATHPWMKTSKSRQMITIRFSFVITQLCLSESPTSVQCTQLHPMVVVPLIPTRICIGVVWNPGMSEARFLMQAVQVSNTGIYIYSNTCSLSSSSVPCGYWACSMYSDSAVMALSSSCLAMEMGTSHRIPSRNLFRLSRSWKPRLRYCHRPGRQHGDSEQYGTLEWITEWEEDISEKTIEIRAWNLADCNVLMPVSSFW